MLLMQPSGCPPERRATRAFRLRSLLAAAAALCVAGAAAAAAGPQQGAGPSYRIFLTDGTPVISLGEFARAGGRVVFTVPIGSPSSPDAMHVVSLPDSAVDWDRTERYTDAVRHQSYAATRGNEDFAALTGAVARALGDMAFAADASAKLAIAADIRRQLLEWPAAHFGFRSADVRELTGHVEEAISAIRAGAGLRTFDLSLVAMIEPPSEPLLPEPGLQETLTRAAAVAQAAETRRERATLQESILAVLDRRKRELPKDWHASTRKDLARRVGREQELDRAYAELSSRALRDAREREQDADVAGLEQLAARVQRDDARLGYQRPETMQALLASLAASAASAREKRVARDRYEWRHSAYRSYRRGIEDTLEKFDEVIEEIVAVRSFEALSGRRLSRTEKRVGAIVVGLLPAQPPAELASAHELLLSSARLMTQALQLQRATAPARGEASQNASAAAAGALLLLDSARRSVDGFFRKPAAP